MYYGNLSFLSIALKVLPYVIPFILGAGIIWTYHDYQNKRVVVNSVDTMLSQQETFINELERVEESRRQDEERRQQVIQETETEWLESPADPVLVDALARLRGES